MASEGSIQNAEAAADNPDDGRPAKRKRIALACEPCRDRKVKCDGGKPTCKVCQKRTGPTVQCVYTLVPQTAKQLSEQEYIISLRKQIQDLQQTVRDTTSQPQDAAANLPASSETRARSNEVRWMDNSPQQHNGRRATAASPLGFIRSPGVQRNDKPSPVSAMGASMVDAPTSPRTSEIYGQSSVHSLLQEVSHVSKSRSSRSSNRSNRPVAQGPAAMVGAQYALPPRQVADELLALFFSNVHVFYPYMHSISFQRRYESLWSRDGYPGPPLGDVCDIGLGGDRCPPNTFFCALNAMFALGCEFSKMSEREEASAMFRHRMQDLLQADLLDCASISHVQTLLLSGHYLLTTEHPTRCYNIVGLACRIAVGLGLHSPGDSMHLTALGREVRRRVWYASLQLEMTVCMTLGRPPLLQVNDDVPLPIAIDDEHLTMSVTCEQPQDVLSQNLFMVENLKLVKVLAMILGYIYGADLRGPLGTQPRPTESQDGGMSALLRLDDTLDRCEASVSDPLNWKCDLVQGAPLITNILQRQRNVLRARFLHLRILLYRPSFSLYCSSLRRLQLRKDNAAETTTTRGDETEGGVLTATIRKRCAMSCVQAACELAKAIEVATMKDVTGAWWFGLFYLVTCGGIVILAQCAQLSGSHFDQTELDSTWDSCITALQELGRYHSRAEGYVHHLLSLRERAMNDYLSTHASKIPSRVASRRPSAEPFIDGRPDGSSMGHYGEHDDTTMAHVGNEFGYATLLDSWEYNLENGGFGFDDDMSFNFPTYLFSSTN